ncbi:GABA-specific high-affinity permease [Orbilia oligospora]|uniref:GABA-specific high-affinity permease n=1 Tax=Orbilia oligospora TaxID=2813651 RepID=A0A7C8NAW2_ORBOL|nr:GABA-specific high-affinity permease [Orbilia oligospora]KAF3104470.1 GABA-specific high-affinity permease [Orbilia oligospora]KAF3112183.1 GABA-specific high-affinity permease [Orbilia oligospora]KAF3147344.1 GABA-specific high-affinity permease [Orbilia oligospora]KAF3150591.1 GABA-specific high-affinity permease [Orbilia oligospora]
MASNPPTEVLAKPEDADMLAKMGYAQELKRNFSKFEVLGIAFAIMGLLPSIASTLTFSIPAGPAGMVWGWFITSGFIFVVGLAMSDLGSAMPTAGGLYWWTHHFSAPRYKNPLSFLVGYSNTLGLVGGLCSIDYGFALMLVSVIVLVTDGAFVPTNGIIYCVFLGCVISHGFVVMFASKVNIMGKMQTVFTIANLLLIAATFVVLPVGRKGERNSAKYVFTETANLTGWPSGWAFFLAWLSPIWTIGGFDSCVHISEEAKNASLAVPWGILGSIGLCWSLGFLCCIVIASCMSTDLESILNTPFGQPMAQIYYDAVGKKGAIIMMTFLFLTQWLMGISILLASSRQAWAFSRDGALPFSKFFSKISKRFGHTPIRCVWGCAGLACVLGLLCLIASAAASALFSLCAAGNNFAWFMPIFARLVWGRDKFVPGPFYTGKFSIPIAIVACIFLVFSTLLAMMPVTGPHVTPETMNYTVVVNCAVWGGALAYYFIDARKWFTGPKMTIDAEQLTEEQERKMMEDRSLDVKRDSMSGGKKDMGDIKASKRPETGDV